MDMQKVARECPEFGILVIGERGDGQSALVKSLLGVDITTAGDTTQAKTGVTAKIAGFQ